MNVSLTADTGAKKRSASLAAQMESTLDQSYSILWKAHSWARTLVGGVDS